MGLRGLRCWVDWFMSSSSRKKGMYGPRLGIVFALVWLLRKTEGIKEKVKISYFVLVSSSFLSN